MATVTTPRTNLVTNPSASAGASLSVARTNLVTNPSFETGTTGVFPSGVVTVSTTTYAPAVTVGTQALNIAIGAGATTYTYIYQIVPVTAGQWLTFAANIRWSTGSRYAKFRIDFRDGSNVSQGTATSPIYQCYGTTGGDRHLVSGLAPATTTQALLFIYFYDDAAGTVAPINPSTLATDAWHAATAADQASAEWRAATYFDGATAADPDFTYAWTGTAHASTSTCSVTIPTGYGSLAGTGGVSNISKTADTPLSGAQCGRVLWTQLGQGGSAGLTYTFNVTGVTGDNRSARVWLRSSVSKSVAFLFRFRDVSTAVGSKQTSYVTLQPGVWTEYIADNVTATADYTNIQMYPLINNSAANNAGETLDFDCFQMVNAPATGLYFDGDSLSYSPAGYSPAATYSYSWTGTANASTSVETLTVPLQDYQVQLPDGTIIGAGTDVGLKSIDGLRSLPDLRDGDSARGQQDGANVGLSLLGERSVVFEFEVFDPKAGTEAAVQSVTRNWQNVADPNDVAMLVGDYLSQLATGGTRPVSAVQVQLPGRPVPLLLLGRPKRLRVPVDQSYQYRNAKITAEWGVPDGTLYDVGVVSSSCGLPSPVSGLTFPATPPFTFGTSSGGSIQITNAGKYDAFPLLSVTGPCYRPIITKGSTGEFIRLNITLLAGDQIVVDAQSKAVTYNGANRNNVVEPGSSFFTLPPGTSTVQFGSSDATAVSGVLTASLLNTYSTI